MIGWETDWDMLDSVWQTIVVPVNCKGTMGNGLALAMANRYPGLLDYYKHLCRTKQLKIGTVGYWSVDPFKRILIFPTKDFWGHPSQLSYIEDGLKAFVSSYERNGITAVVFPPLGCGKGGLDYQEVRKLLWQYLEPIRIPVGLCTPQDYRKRK